MPPNADGSFYYHDLAGGKAFYLLAKENPSLFDSISAPAWSKWAGFLFRQPNWDYGEDNAAIRNKLLLKAYQNNPADITDFLIKLIITENDKDGNIFVQEKIELSWNSNLEKALVEMLRRNKLKPQAHGEILKVLLKKKNEKAAEEAKAFIRKKPSKKDEERYFITAQILLAEDSSAHWKAIWKRITDTPSFGKLFLEKISYESRNGSKLLSQLPEADLASLYIWLVNQYPYEEDGKRAGGAVSPRDSIAMWRDNVLNTIVNRGTSAACEQMKSIIKRFPKHDWLQRSLLHALLNKRRNSWTPPKPEWILVLSNDKNKRWIQSGDDLLNVIIDCLKEAELLLQGETPQSRYLWNIKPIIVPKEENDFSDWVKNHLDQYLAKKGIVLAREVEIRKGHGNHSGQITDIHVTALIPKNTAKHEFEPIKAIIEVKGCWNDGLYKDMKIQLKDRYLKDNLCKHGLYLVGWFNCVGWNSADQKKRAPKKNLEDVKDFLEAQAKQLSDSNATVRSLVINTGFK